MFRCRRCNQFVAMLGLACICGEIASGEKVEFTMPDKAPGYADQQYTEPPHIHQDVVPPGMPRVLAQQVSTSAIPLSSHPGWGIGWSPDEYVPTWQPHYPLVLRLPTSTAAST
jgi:hypothetical protein